MSVTRKPSLPGSFNLSICLAILVLPFLAGTSAAASLVESDPQNQFVTLTDGDGQLSLRINYHDGLRLDQIKVRGREVTASNGVYTGIQADKEWYSSQATTPVKVTTGKNMVRITGIEYGNADYKVQESWVFTALSDRIAWKITRQYSGDETLTDIAFPQWNFADVSTWTGGMLDNGGVVWDKYLDGPNATYGGHFGAVTFWNVKADDGLRITPTLPAGDFGAGRFSRRNDGTLLFDYSISPELLQTKHGLSRFLSDRQDLWNPVQIQPSKTTAEFELQAIQYSQAYDRGTFTGLDGNSVRELLNTVARYGVIDSHLVGGNGWRSGYICLHEPFFGQIAGALDAADYTKNFSAALDFSRDHAIEPDGRVKSRWCYGGWDAMPGTYDKYGFYEAQWGYLLDSQPDYVMNVAEQFNNTGDVQWLASHKASCEQALEYLTRREVGNSGLVAMMTDSCKQNRGSDWIDIIWASYENALVNAELYDALNLWAAAEQTLNDTNKADNYRAFAARLKNSFNQPISQGGFWDPTNNWYIYWRDKDGSTHGNNLVTPVNFAAIAYGLCDDPARRQAILDRMESEMQKENLFYWPLSFFPYQREEGAGSNFPFPRYENGDIFLSWGELGVRAYAAYKPALALKYVKSTLARYAKDGLSFQRYLRDSQRGEGDDILAGNCMPIVGLYRDIYGLQPKPNRLFLDPHLTDDLVGTQLRYTLRDQLYEVTPGPNASTIATANGSIQAPNPFGVNATPNSIQYFHDADNDWSLSVSLPQERQLSLQILNWSDDSTNPVCEWTETVSPKTGKLSHMVKHLAPNAKYQVTVDDRTVWTFQADSAGILKFVLKLNVAKSHHIVLKPI